MFQDSESLMDPVCISDLVGRQMLVLEAERRLYAAIKDQPPAGAELLTMLVEDVAGFKLQLQDAQDAAVKHRVRLQLRRAT